MTIDKKRIYIVDDDKNAGAALGSLVRSAGFNVQEFNSLQGFLDSVPTDSQGTLILNSRTPGIDGFEFKKKLKTFRSGLELIFIKAYVQLGGPEVIQEAAAKGILAGIV